MAELIFKIGLSLVFSGFLVSILGAAMMVFYLIGSELFK